MGGFAESMRDFWEGVAGFLTLGGRHLANKIGCLIRGIRVRNLEKKITVRQTELGRRAWSLRVLSAETFPIVDKIDSFERAISAKEEALEEVRARIGDMQKQRQEHLALYQNKISEQLKQKQPVEDEYTGLLVEARRLKRELDLTQGESKSLAGKYQLQTKRLEELMKTNGERSEEYLLSEVRHEIGFLERTIALKREKTGFLSIRLEEKTQSAERTGKVVAQYVRQIADLRRQQGEGTIQFDASLHKLHTSRHQIERDIRKLRLEMGPLFGELGSELRRRPFDLPELTRHYADIGNLESEKESLLSEIGKLRSDSASIGAGIKIGFYGMIILFVALFVWLLIVLI